MLLWAGYDPSAPDEDTGATPLHSMANLSCHRFTNSRAMRYLLKAGADPNHSRHNGDMPLITLCGNTRWYDDHTECFMVLAQGGADLFAEASDGATPLSLLEEHQANHLHPSRAELIEMVKTFIEQSDLDRTTPQTI